MSNKKMNIDSQAIASSMSERIKSAVKDGNNLQELPNIILDILKTHGIELPEKVKQAIQEYQAKK